MYNLVELEDRVRPSLIVEETASGLTVTVCV